MKKYLIFIFAILFVQINVFAQMQKEVQKQVKGSVKCENYSLGSDCYCHRYMYQQTINGKANYTAKGASSSAMLLAKQRECMHAYNAHYSGASEYEKKLKQIPSNLIPAEEQSKGNIQAQYLFNKETEAAFRDPKVNNTEKADEFLDKNIEILIANMINKGWAAKNIMKQLYAGNLTTEQKEAALQTLNANLPNVGKCKSDICKVPGTVGDVAELFANCGEDACMLTALHIELFNSLVQSGAKSVTTDQALNLFTGMLVRNVGDTQSKSKRFGDKQANATVKIPVLKAILELGDEDYYLKTTKKVLDKKTMSYSDSDTEVMSFIIDSYSAMNKYDPLIEMALNQTKNKVARIEAAIALAESDHPEILTDEEKQKIANILHYSYADETTACPKFVGETKVGGRSSLAGLKSPTETDAILKQRICDAYMKLNIEGTRTDLPCYPCEGNLGTDVSTFVGEMLVSFVLDDAADDLLFGALTLGVGTVTKHIIVGPKYINKAKRLANKVRSAVKGGNKFTDKITAGVRVPKKARKTKKVKRYTLAKSSNGKTVAIWETTTKPDASDVKKAATTPNAVKKGNPNVEGNINDVAGRSDFGNQLGNTDVSGKTPKGTTQPKGQTSGSRPVVDPNKMKEMPQNAGKPKSTTPQNKPVTNTTKPVSNTTDVKNGVNAAEDIAARLPAETVPELPKKTALNPTELEPKLTGKLNDEITLAKAGGTPTVPETRTSAGFHKQELPRGQSTASGAPEGMRRQIGFGNQDKYIPETAGIRDPNGPGVQNVTNGMPGQRTPEGPAASRNSNFRNQVGGTPDTPGTPQQNLSDLNKNISNTPANQSTALTQSEADDLFARRKRQYEDMDDGLLKNGTKQWMSLDEEFHGIVGVELDETSGGVFTKITKADGSSKYVETTRLGSWLNGVPGTKMNISQKELDAIKGYKKFFGRETDFFAANHKEIIDKALSSSSRYPGDTKLAAELWKKEDDMLHGTVMIEPSPGTDHYRVVKADGSQIYVSGSDIESWINGVSGVRGAGITQRERNSIKGLDDFLNTRVAKKTDIDLNQKQVSSIAKGQSSGLTKSEADDLFKQRQSQRESRPGTRQEANWGFRDEEFSGTVKIERAKEPGEWIITKADGSKHYADRERFETWLNGVPGAQGCNISDKERKAIQGLDNFGDPYEARVDKRWQDIERKGERRSYTDEEWSRDIEGVKRDEKFHGATKVEISGTTRSGTIPRDRAITVTKADGTTYKTNLNEFEEWINDTDYPISQKEKDAIKGLDDLLDAKKKTQQMDKLFHKNGQLPELIAYRPKGIKDRLNYGCSDYNSCKNLVEDLIDNRKKVHDETSSLLSLYAKETGNNNVDDMYKSLLDFFERKDYHHDGYDYLNDFLNDNELRNFLFNNGNIPGFQNISKEFVGRSSWPDCAMILRSEVPDTVKPLKQLANDNDWEIVVKQARNKLQSDHDLMATGYEDLLYSRKVKDVSPEIFEYLLNGGVPHYRNLTKAGIDKDTAADLVYRHHWIKYMENALK